MMMEIIKIVIVPIGAALLHDYLKLRVAARAEGGDWLAALGAVVAAFFVGGGGWIF